MKIFITPLFVFFSAFVYGQYDHNIELSSGDNVTHSIAEIDSIFFTDDGAPAMHLQLFEGSSTSFDIESIDQVSFSGSPPAGEPIHCLPGGSHTATVEVYSPSTGRVWMDRNLGASQAATTSDDEAAYGELYQWGRFSDGHQCRTSPMTSILSSSDSPGNGLYISAPDSAYDWHEPGNDNLWQGLGGINNPCPDTYRLPTRFEWAIETSYWISQDISGAFASWLKLPAAGYRGNSTGSLLGVDSLGIFWSYTVAGPYSFYLLCSADHAPIYAYARAFGFSVRCIRD